MNLRQIAHGVFLFAVGLAVFVALPWVVLRWRSSTIESNEIVVVVLANVITLVLVFRLAFVGVRESAIRLKTSRKTLRR